MRIVLNKAQASENYVKNPSQVQPCLTLLARDVPITGEVSIGCPGTEVDEDTMTEEVVPPSEAGEPSVATVETVVGVV